MKYIRTKDDVFELIEEELGIDFITLKKALEEGIYDSDGFYHHVALCRLEKRWCLLNIGSFQGFMPTDYGKTWFFSKEEARK